MVFKHLCLLWCTIALLVAVETVCAGQKQANPTFEKVIKSGDLAALKSLLAHGADPNSTEEAGFPALASALEVHRADMVELLLAKGADPNVKGIEGLTPIMIACDEADLPMIKLLVSKGAKPDSKDQDRRSVLEHAALATTVMQALENRLAPRTHRLGADVPAVVELRKKQQEIVRYLLDAGGASIIRGKNGADNFDQLIGASLITDTNFAALMLDRGVDVNLKNSNGALPLATAAGYGLTEIVKQILAKGADVNAGELQGRTALQGAAEGERLEIVKLLIERGARINATDEFGRTALMAAAVLKLEHDFGSLIGRGSNVKKPVPDSPEMVNYLIAKGADVNAKDQDGATALSLAQKYGRKAVAQALKQAGAK